MPDPIPITRAYAEQLLHQTSHDLGLPIGITPAERARLAHDLEVTMHTPAPVTITGEYGTTLTLTARPDGSARVMISVPSLQILDDLTPQQLGSLRDTLCQMHCPAQASDNSEARSGGQ